MRELSSEITGVEIERRSHLKLNDNQMTMLRFLVEVGDAAAQVALAAMFLAKTEATGDVRRAIELLEKAAAQGYPDAEFNLGEAYFFGVGVERNPRIAADWIGKAAARGHREAQFRLGRMYDSGLGVAKDRKTARDWFRKAAAIGHAEARLRVYSGV